AGGGARADARCRRRRRGCGRHRCRSPPARGVGPIAGADIMTAAAVITPPTERLFTRAEVSAAIDPWREMLTEAHVRMAGLIRENHRLRSAHLLCDTCGAQPCVNPSFCAVCRAVDQRKTAPPKPRPRPTPQTLIDAIMYCVCQRSTGALREPANV